MRAAENGGLVRDWEGRETRTARQMRHIISVITGQFTNKEKEVPEL